MSNPTRHLADLCANLACSDIPEPVVARCDDLFLSWLGSAHAGANEHSTAGFFRRTQQMKWCLVTVHGDRRTDPAVVTFRDEVDGAYPAGSPDRVDIETTRARRHTEAAGEAATRTSIDRVWTHREAPRTESLGSRSANARIRRINP